MDRVAISAGIAAVLAVTAVALGAGTDVRIHRLHVPPPPTGEETGTPAPPGPNPTDPSAPPGTSPPVAPPAPGAPPPPPAPPAGLTCTTDNGTSADVTGTLSDYAIAAVPSAASVASTLRFRGVYPAGGGRSTQPLTARLSRNPPVRDAQPGGRRGADIRRDQLAAGDVRALLHDPRGRRHEDSLHRQLTSTADRAAVAPRGASAAQVTRRERVRRRAAAARASSHRATRPSWPRSPGRHRPAEGR